jgi:hypothetical protein
MKKGNFLRLALDERHRDLEAFQIGYHHECHTKYCTQPHLGRDSSEILNG